MANVYVSDTGHGSIRIGKPSLPDAAAIDDGTALPGLTRLLFPEPDTADSWQWSIIRRPADSTASLSSTTIRNPTFTPDKSGVYSFQLTATRDGVASITTIDLNTEPRRRRAVRQ